MPNKEEVKYIVYDWTKNPLNFGGHASFLGETSKSWDRPIPEIEGRPTITINVYQNTETGAVEYFHHELPFNVKLNTFPSGADDDGVYSSEV